MPRGVRPNGESSDAARSIPPEDRESRSRPLSASLTPLPAEASSSRGPLPTVSKTTAEPARRVLPARLRRSAGGGAEGIRDLEEMVVDWLERYGQFWRCVLTAGDPSTSPPEGLQIVISSLHSSLLSTFVVGPGPSVAKPEVRIEPQAGPSRPSRIETPSWRLVLPGEDDAAEAREEMAAKLLSPTKRLRRGVVGDEVSRATDGLTKDGRHFRRLLSQTTSKV